MANVQWVKYKDMGGPRCLGSAAYNPTQPLDKWQKIMGVVARCEGNHDTVVMYDGTGVTWGFLQWTFTSGRLQNLLRYIKKHYPEAWGDFFMKNGSFILAPYGIPESEIDSPKMNKPQLVAACMATKLPPDNARSQAMGLAKLFVTLGQAPEIQKAQIEFAIDEFSKSLPIKRLPMVGKVNPATIDTLLKDTWETPLPALFFNLWQNSPSGAYTMFSKAFAGKTSSSTAESYFQDVWKRLNVTKYADWGWGSKQYLESGKKNPPRIVRIQPALKEFYGVDLPFFK